MQHAARGSCECSKAEFSFVRFIRRFIRRIVRTKLHKTPGTFAPPSSTPQWQLQRPRYSRRQRSSNAFNETTTPLTKQQQQQQYTFNRTQSSDTAAGEAAQQNCMDLPIGGRPVNMCESKGPKADAAAASCTKYNAWTEQQPNSYPADRQHPFLPTKAQQHPRIYRVHTDAATKSGSGRQR